jgi:hypothetical protein
LLEGRCELLAGLRIESGCQRTQILPVLVQHNDSGGERAATVYSLIGTVKVKRGRPRSLVCTMCWRKSALTRQLR